MIHRYLVILSILTIGALAVLSCGSERTSSGVWRDPGCVDDSEETPCLSEVYELHLGRCGQTVTGVVVRYRGEEGFDPYQRTNACDCFFVESGRADGDKLQFRLFEPDEACQATGTVGRGGCTECDCAARRFKLVAQDGDTLVGTMTCPDQPSTTVRFVRSDGRVRTRCSDLSEKR